MFCNAADRLEGKFHCGDRWCRQFDYDLRREHRMHELYGRRMAIRNAVVERCKHVEDLGWCQTLDLDLCEFPIPLLGRMQRWFYTAKAIVCVILNWRGGLSGQIKIEHLSNVAHWDIGPGGEAGERWTELYVGRGLMSNWCYEISGNSSY